MRLNWVVTNLLMNIITVPSVIMESQIIIIVAASFRLHIHVIHDLEESRSFEDFDFLRPAEKNCFPIYF